MLKFEGFSLGELHIFDLSNKNLIFESKSYKNLNFCL